MLRGSVIIGQDADNVLCCLAKVCGVGDFGELKYFGNNSSVFVCLVDAVVVM